MFGVPVINIGSRQSGRERTPNITDVAPTRQAITEKTQEALARPESCNAEEESIYGDGRAGQRIADILENINLESIIQKKLRNNT
jgi:UDP-N-acetylglucosamine 2-epimerase